MGKKNFCNADSCLLEERSKRIEEIFDLEGLVNKFIQITVEDNPDIHPACIKRFVADCLRSESARLVVEIMTKTKQSYQRSYH